MDKILESFLTKIILFALAGFFHFSTYAWEASESNCREENYGLTPVTEYKCSIDKSACSASNVGSNCSDPKVQGVCERIEDLTDNDARKYNYRDRECQEWKEKQREQDEHEREAREREEKLELEFAKEQAEKLEKEKERALEEQQKMIENAKNECTSSYERVVRNRDRIENQVRRKQEQLDQMENTITNHYASISEGEDKVSEEILKLKQQERQVMNTFKQEKIKAEQTEQAGDRALVQEIEKIENALLESTATLEDMADFKQQICSNRSMEYLKISVKCYNEKLEQVSTERASLYQRISTGRFEATNINDLFQMDSQNIDQTFKRRLDALHTHCFEEKTGENLPHPGQSLKVQIPCDLEAFEGRAELCQKENNNRSFCPVKPEVQVIEQKALAQLRKVKKDKEKVERARKQALKEIERLREENEESKKWMARALADLEEQLRVAKKDFEEKHERAENELKRVREKAENSILQIERDKIRLLASDPARHFEEQLIVAKASCCHSVSPQQTAQQCALLSRYEQDPVRFQFAFIRPLPALRSTSGPSSARSRKTSGSGVQ